MSRAELVELVSHLLERGDGDYERQSKLEELFVNEEENGMSETVGGLAAAAGAAEEAALSELDRYKALVRAVAIRTARQQSWCREGLNEVLEELYLERHDRQVQRVRLQVDVDVAPSDRTALDAREAAIRYVQSLPENGSRRVHRVQWDFTDTIEID